MSDEPIKRKRGRPRNPEPEPRATPTIQEGASWHVGDRSFDGPDPGGPVPEQEQEELRRRHNEEMEKANNVKRAIEISAMIEQPIEPNSVIQIKADPRMGQLVLVGEVEGDLIHCYQFSFDGIEYMTVKQSECVVIGGPKKGMRVLRYEKPENSPTPEDKDS